MNVLEVYLEKLELDRKDVYEISPSKIHGNGIISKKHFKPGDYINICVSKIKRTYPHFEITKFGSYLNHSCFPNAEIRRERNYYTTYARKEIKPGDEITVNYTEYQEFAQPKPHWK